MNGVFWQNEIMKYVTNSVSDIRCDYSVIIGIEPSKGARSPTLWNEAYRALDKTTLMMPLDVSANNLEPLIRFLESDDQFIGGSIAAPYKELVTDILPSTSNHKFSRFSSFNCIFRGASGDLTGCNTDGMGALATLESLVDVEKTNILLIGPGGTGKAIAQSIVHKSGRPDLLAICSRKKDAIEFAEILGATWLHIDSLASAVSNFGLIINCTPLGQGVQLDESPIAQNVIGKISKGSQIFDINYSIKKSLLSKQAAEANIKYVNGSLMNLEQAVKSFCIVNSAEDCSEEVRRVMKHVVSRIES